MFIAPPPIEGDVMLRSPASEVRAPLFWSLLGAAALVMGVLGRSAGAFERLA